MDTQPVKVQFAFHSHLLDQWTVETVWAEPVPGTPDAYRVLSIPFYVTGVALHDVVIAEFTEAASMLSFQKVIESGGHSTIQLVRMAATTDMSPVLARLEETGCAWEQFGDAYFVLDVADEVDYFPIRQLLLEWQTAGVLDYAEACLSAAHFYDD